MSVFYRESRGTWEYDFQRHGKRYCNTCIDPETGIPAANKTEAKRLETRLKAEIDRQHKEAGGAEAAESRRRAEEQAKAVFTVAEAFSAYSTRKRGTTNWENSKVYVRELVTWFGPLTDVRDVTDTRVWQYIAWARQQPVTVYMGAGTSKAAWLAKGIDPSTLYRPAKDGRPRSDSTINRYLGALREAMRIAHDIRDHEGRRIKLPVMPKVPDLAEPERLPRPISDDDLWAAADRAPAHLAWAILLTRLMGFRKAEVFGLRRQQVDVANRGIWLAAEDTKGNRDEFIPAGGEAMELLEYLTAEAIARGTDFLITYRRARTTFNVRGGKAIAEGRAVLIGPARPIKNPKKSWATVLKALGLDGVHKFHNTKASFVTAIAHAAAPAVTQQLARHKDYRTTERYLKVNDMAARAAVDAVAIRVNAPSPGQRVPDKVTDGKNEKAANPKAAAFFDNLVGATGFEPATPSPPD